MIALANRNLFYPINSPHNSFIRFTAIPFSKFKTGKFHNSRLFEFRGLFIHGLLTGQSHISFIVSF